MNRKADTPKLKRILRTVLMTVLHILPVLAMFWIWRDSCRAALAVLDGTLFRVPWHIVHAGFSLDQPTIGKWYFWSTIFSGTWIVFAVASFLICKPCSRSIRRVYAILTLCTFYIQLLVHTVPSFWTLQYVHTMGITHRRLIALAWGITGYVVLITMTGLLVQQALKNKKPIER